MKGAVSIAIVGAFFCLVSGERVTSSIHQQVPGRNTTSLALKSESYQKSGTIMKKMEWIYSFEGVGFFSLN